MIPHHQNTQPRQIWSSLRVDGVSFRELNHIESQQQMYRLLRVAHVPGKQVRRKKMFSPADAEVGNVLLVLLQDIPDPMRSKMWDEGLTSACGRNKSCTASW